jgi:hypothetical protein
VVVLINTTSRVDTTRAFMEVVVLLELAPSLGAIVGGSSSGGEAGISVSALAGYRVGVPTGTSLAAVSSTHVSSMYKKTRRLSLTNLGKAEKSRIL